MPGTVDVMMIALQMMKHAWDSYVKYAWGSNELRPISRRGHSASIFGSLSLGATIVDAIDTLYIMGLEEEYKKARDWIATNLNFDGASVRSVCVMCVPASLHVYGQCVCLCVTECLYSLCLYSLCQYVCVVSLGM